MAALGTVTIVVFAPVSDRLHRPGKQVAGLFDLIANLGQIGQLEGSTVGVDQVLEGHPIEHKAAVGIDIKALLWKIKCLVN